MASSGMLRRVDLVRRAIRRNIAEDAILNTFYMHTEKFCYNDNFVISLIDANRILMRELLVTVICKSKTGIEDTIKIHVKE
jgi:hypothetical protein